MKKLVYLVYAALILAALAIAAVAAFALLFDPNKFKPEIEQLVQRSTQRTLKLEGELGLAFYPSLGVSLGRTTLSERNGAKEFAAVDSAHVSMAVLPLLRGEMVADEVRLSGLRASVVRFKDGSTNVDDLVGPAPSTRVPPEPQKESKALRFDVSGTRIEDARLSFRDETTGQELTAEGLNLRTGRIADDVPGTLRFSARLTGKNPALDLRLDLAGEYRFNLGEGVFSLSGLDAKAAGRIAEVSGLELGAKGDLAARPDKHSFSAVKFALQAKGSIGQETFEARLSAPKLSVTADKAEGEKLDAEVKLQGAQRAVEAKLVLSGVQGSSTALAASEFSAEFDARAGENSAKGRFSSPLRADLPARRYELSKILATMTLSSPQVPQKTVALQMNGSASADLAKDSATADLNAKLDETTARLKLDLRKLAAPEAGFDLAVDRLDLDRYLPPRKEASASAGSTAAGAGAEPPLDLSALKGVTASGRAQFGSLVVQRLKLAEVRAEIRLAKGRLEISPHSAMLYEGSLAGALSVDANGNRLALKENLQGVSVGPLVRDVAGRDAIEGRGNVSLELQGAGATVGAIKKSLDGNARIALRDGAIKGINIGEKLRKARATLGSQSAKRELAEGAEKTDFSELSASFVIRDGVARNDDLAAKSPFLRLSGAGEIDIGNSKIDYVAKATVVASGKGQGGAELDRLAGITVPVKLSGTFDAPGYEVDYGAVAAGLAKSKVADKLGERLGIGAPKDPTQGAAEAVAPRDRVKEKLRGLIGR